MAAIVSFHPGRGAAIVARAEYPESMSSPSPPRILLAIGLPGSGKSTWFAKQGLQPLSSDTLRLLLFDNEEDQTNQRAVFAMLRLLLRKRLELGRPLTCIDATHLSRWERAPYLHMARLWDCEVEAVFFDEPFDVCLARNANRSRVVPEPVMRRMRDRLQPPTLAEGFSRIVVVRDGVQVSVLPETLHQKPQN
jgi:predicted kinase